VLEDRPMQALQFGAGFHADLFDEHGACVAICLQCLRLPPGSVEREHSLRVQSLAQRVCRDQRIELADHLGVARGRKVFVDRPLDRPEPQLLEPLDLDGGERLIAQVREWLAAPQRERLTRVPVLEQARETHYVQILVLHPELVAAPARDDFRAVAVHQPTQLRDVELHHLRRTCRRVVTPEPVDQAIGRHGAAGVQREHGERRPLLRRTEGDRAAVDECLDRP
jgi:hypothetical protein